MVRQKRTVSDRHQKRTLLRLSAQNFPVCKYQQQAKLAISHRLMENSDILTKMSETETAPKEGKKENINPLSVESGRFIELLAQELKGISQIKPPAWTSFVKTGMHKERPPARKDWWHIRAASVLRTIARLGPIGTSKLRTKYGGKHSRGYKSERFARGSGSIIRKAIQQLEKAGLVKQTVKGVHKGRVATEKASALMNTVASKVTAEPKPSRSREAKP